MKTQIKSELTSAQKGKLTKAMKKLDRHTGEDLIAVREMATLYILAGEPVDFISIDAEMVKRARIEALAAEPAAKATGTTRTAMTFGEAIEKAQEMLGPDAVVWTDTRDYKGREFTAPRVYVGIPTSKPNGYIVSEGRLMIGTGASFAGAISDTRKRLAAAATDKTPAARQPNADASTQPTA